MENGIAALGLAINDIGQMDDLETLQTGDA
jgi:hypothetical protein